jgi:hypothetical protein
VRTLLLKAGATALALVAAAAAAVHVSGNVRSSSAPLHPVVLGGSGAVTKGGPLSPSVRSGSVEAVTSTHVS